MAHNIKITDVSTGPKHTGLVIEHGSEKLVLSSKGLNTFSTKGMPFKPITGAKATHILDEVLQEIHKNGGKLPDKVKADLSKVLPHFEGFDVYPGLLSKVKENTALLDELKGLTHLEAAEALLVKHPHLKPLLTAEETSRLGTMGVDLASIEKKVASLAAQATKIEGLTKEFNTLLAADKFDPKAVGEFMAKNAHQLEHITPSEEALGKAAKTGFNYKSAVLAINEEVATHTSKVESLLGEWVQHQRTISLDPDQAKVTAAKDAAAKLEAEFKPILSGEYGNAVKGKLPKELVNNVGEHSADLGKSLSAEVAEKGGKIGGFLKSIIVRGDAAEKGLTGLKSLSWKKGGALAVGAVGLAYVAGVGRNPKGKYTDQVQQQQLDAQQMGVGVA